MFQQKCIVSSPYYYKIIPAMSSVEIEMDVDDCEGVNQLEHVSTKYTHVTYNKLITSIKLLLICNYYFFLNNEIHQCTN